MQGEVRTKVRAERGETRKGGKCSALGDVKVRMASMEEKGQSVWFVKIFFIKQYGTRLHTDAYLRIN